MALPSEPPDAGDRPRHDQPGGASLPPYADDAAILAWLDVLLKGKPEEQAAARTEIGLILEARGYLDDAEEAYWTNIQARATDRRAYERLLAIYQQRKDRLSETLVRRQLDEVFGPPAPPVDGETGTVGGPGVTNGYGRANGRAEADGHALDDVAPFGAAPVPPLAPRPARPTRRLRRARDRSETSPAASTGPDRPGAPGQRVGSSLDVPPSTGRPAGTGAVGARDLAPRARAADPSVEVSSEPAWEAAPDPVGGRRWSAPRAPRVGAFARTGTLIVLEPTTIGAFLLASFGAAALIIFLLLTTDRGASARPAAEAAGQAASAQLPARCADATLRFPGAHDPRAAVIEAYRQQGIEVEPPRPGGPRVTTEAAQQVVGGWMGIALVLEHAGQPAPTLAGWLDPETSSPSLANAILSGRGLESMLTAQEWAELQAWPATSCEGAFVRDPRNAGLVRMIERVVAR